MAVGHASHGYDDVGLDCGDAAVESRCEPVGLERALLEEMDLGFAAGCLGVENAALAKDDEMGFDSDLRELVCEVDGLVFRAAVAEMVL